MKGSEPNEAKLAPNRTTSQDGFMAAGTGLFDWEQRFFGQTAEQARKVPEEAQSRWRLRLKQKLRLNSTATRKKRS
jgi:hypothetical protein